jgi:hypothetical protein
MPGAGELQAALGRAIRGHRLPLPTDAQLAHENRT